ncbi:NADPH:quinone reductase [Cryptotrichosporon argae]
MSTIPATHKVVLIEQHGDYDVNVLREVPVPQPKDDEVLIKVEWTGANYIDNYRRVGLYPIQLPFIQGQDVVGTLLSVPTTHASRFPLKVGDRVLSPVGSAFAQHVAAPAHRVAPLPAGVSAQDGVSVATVGMTAWALATESYEIKEGDWVLIRAAAGGVGGVLVQLAKYFGANVIGTVSTPEKAEIVKGLGADHVLLSTAPEEENVKEIVRLADGKGVHVVYDGVGKDTFEEDFLVVRPKATIVTFGNSSGAVPPFAPLKLTPKALKLTRPTLAPFIDAPDDFARYARSLFGAIEAGALKFPVHKVYPFSEDGVRQTQKDIQSRATTGKLLIKVAE